jgi:hypothetical protein
LYISNTSTTSPLIYGDFSGQTLRINNKLGVNMAPTHELDVSGIARISTGIILGSGSTLSTYVTVTSGTTALTNFSGSPTMVMHYTRIGNVVYLRLPNVELTFGGATLPASFPVPFNPSVEQNGWVKTRQAGSWTLGGSFSISTAGTCLIYKDVGDIGFTAAATLCGWAPQTITYHL